MKKKICNLIIFCLHTFVFSQIQIYSPFDAIKIGIENSQELKLLTEKALNEKKISKYSVSDFFPIIFFGLSQTDSLKINSNDIMNKSVQIGLTQTIYNGGRTSIAYEMQKINSEYENLSVEVKCKNFMIEILKTYFNYLILERKMKIKIDLLDNVKKEFEICKKEFELGLCLEIDLIENEIQLINIEQEVNQIKQELETSFRIFKRILCLENENKIIIASGNDFSVSEEVFMIDYADKIINLALNTNIDIKKSKCEIDLLKKQYRYNNLKFFPQTSLETNISFSGKEYPLTNPDFSIKLKFNFDNFPFVSSSFVSDTISNFRGTNNQNNNMNASINADFTYFLREHVTKLDLESSEINLTNQINELKENLIQQIEKHDNYLRNISQFQKKISLNEKKLEILFEEVKRGEKNRIDYLNALIQSSEDIVSLINL